MFSKAHTALLVFLSLLEMACVNSIAVLLNYLLNWSVRHAQKSLSFYFAIADYRSSTFCRKLSQLEITGNVQFNITVVYTTLAFKTVHGVYVYCRVIARFRFHCRSKKNFSIPLYSYKVCYFSQSQRALHQHFIISTIKYHTYKCWILPRLLG